MVQEDERKKGYIVRTLFVRIYAPKRKINESFYVVSDSWGVDSR